MVQSRYIRVCLQVKYCYRSSTEMWSLARCCRCHRSTTKESTTKTTRSSTARHGAWIFRLRAGRSFARFGNACYYRCTGTRYDNSWSKFLKIHSDQLDTMLKSSYEVPFLSRLRVVRLRLRSIRITPPPRFPIKRVSRLWLIPCVSNAQQPIHIFRYLIININRPARTFSATLVLKKFGRSQ